MHHASLNVQNGHRLQIVAKNPRKKTSQQISKSVQISGDNPTETIQKAGNRMAWSPKPPFAIGRGRSIQSESVGRAGKDEHAFELRAEVPVRLPRNPTPRVRYGGSPGMQTLAARLGAPPGRQADASRQSLAIGNRAYGGQI
jgi:hypothetical protein